MMLKLLFVLTVLLITEAKGYSETWASSTAVASSTSSPTESNPNAVSGCGPKFSKHCHNLENMLSKEECLNDECECKDGFLYDDSIGKCVLPNNCSILCGINETYDKCPQWDCRPQNCSQLGFPWSAVSCAVPNDGPCPGPPGCVCIADHVRNDFGKCVPKKLCPSCGGDPFAESGCGLNCGRLCSNYNKGPVPCPKICYPNACDCKPKYVYDENLKKCVQPENCTPTCGINEVYDKCANGGCRKWKCSQPELCIDPLNCEGGCVCKEKHSRADNGTCIPESQCFQCNKPFEYYDSCAPSCQPQSCESRGKKTECLVQPLYCRGACRCINGYYRDKFGNCIPEKQCELQCPPGEIYYECPDNLCRPLTCLEVGFPIPCPELLGTSSPKCLSGPGCVCDNDYVRDIYGKCIPKNQCPSCGGDPNATPGCGVNCGKTCSTYKDTNPVCILICKLNGCDCKKGYVYDDNLKKCVFPSQCTPICGINEVFDTCSNGGCRRWNCSDKVTCIAPPRCKVGCSCRKGFTRDKNGVCIPENQCPALIMACGRNEVYDTCANGGCRQWNCSKSILCIDPIKCKPGCSCVKGYSRNRFGVCVPLKQCPVPCNGPHEYYDECPQNCPPQTCKSIGKLFSCPAQPIPPVCKGKCMCEKGYYRNLIGECIAEADCKKCPGLDEYFSCGGACDNVCATLQQQNQTNCPIVNIVCNRMCYCRPGYARDKNNICIPIQRCSAPVCGLNEVFDTCSNGGCRRWNCSNTITCKAPPRCIAGCSCRKGFTRDRNGICIPENQCPGSQCPPGERYEVCPENLCIPLICSQVGFPIPCPALIGNSSSNCKPGCICDEDKVRNIYGQCIPKPQCPSCGGDPNATPGCGVNCGKTCSTYKDKNPVCILSCDINGCDCKTGYVYDGNLKKCVLPYQCTPKCGLNEMYDKCVNGGCRRWNCSDYTLCIDPIKCKPGCSCKEGYSRNKIGVCIPEKQCPGICNRPHEYYEECPQTCSPQTCDSIGKIYNCPLQTIPPVCKGKCMCEKGYYRNLIGECISEADCKMCPGPNEYFSCGGACDNVCATLHQQNQTNCPIVNIVCNPMCYCRPGYARDKNNICIPIQRCPKKCTGPHEYFSCGGACDNVCNTLHLQNQTHCPIVNKKCTSMCYCQKGYARNDKNICIPIQQCQVGICGPNERYEEKPSPDCEPRWCSELGFPLNCPAPEDNKPACVCIEGFLRDDRGVCVPTSKCPSCGGDRNAKPGCGKNCGKTCSTYGRRSQLHRIVL